MPRGLFHPLSTFAARIGMAAAHWPNVRAADVAECASGKPGKVAAKRLLNPNKRKSESGV
jgi:hypothetical protein